jgi:DNA-binding MarR family transcriptional regulator
MAGKHKNIDNNAADSAFNGLIDETVKLYRRLNIVAEEVHHQGEMSGGLRSVLRGLKKHGPQTVPHMARTRTVSRQHIQAIVNRLIEEGFVELIANPAHKRSPFVNLTKQGARAVEAMNAHEARLMSQADLGVGEKRLREAAAALRNVREFFESDLWQELLKRR